MPGRVLFPKTGFTTEDLVAVYDQLAPVLLPHLAERPLTLKRFPADVRGEAFWEKDAPNFTPRWIRRFAVPRKHENSLIHYMTLDDEKSLRWAASIGCIEIHSFLHRYPFITSPTLIAFDLDPGPGTDVVDCCAVALEVREWFMGWKMKSFAKVSGSKGVQVYVPLNTPSSYETTQTIAKKVAEDLAERRPDKVVSEMARAERTGKIFVDWSQNAEHKTTVSVYSVRAKQEEPFVSMPVTWAEVQRAVKTRRSHDLVFSPEMAIGRVREVGDIFAPVLTLEQRIPKKLASELGLYPDSAPEAVEVRESSAVTRKMPRSSGQGGRRLFVVHRRDSVYEVAIEHRDQFRLYEFAKMPARKSETVEGGGVGVRPKSYIREESAQTGVVWDMGTYEVFEGSLDRGRATLYFSGERVSGEWNLARDGEKWKLSNFGGRIKGDLPKKRSAAARSAGRGSRTNAA